MTGYSFETKFYVDEIEYMAQGFSYSVILYIYKVEEDDSYTWVRSIFCEPSIHMSTMIEKSVNEIKTINSFKGAST